MTTPGGQAAATGSIKRLDEEAWEVSSKSVRRIGLRRIAH